jgi:SAM-dependent methyltransferase
MKDVIGFLRFADWPGKGVVRRAHLIPFYGEAVSALVDRRLEREPHLRPLFDDMTDDEARVHFGSDDPLEHEHLRRVVRYFHAWRIHTLRERLGDRLASAAILDVGDTDGRTLKELGKNGIGLNISPDAVENIEANGIEARLGDAHRIPFDDESFDVVLCFETLEHVEDPRGLLVQLERVCRPGGRVFISIPWVPRTNVLRRVEHAPPGREHVFEFDRDDFSSLVTHTPLEIVWETVCNVLGPPRRPDEALLLLAQRRRHLVDSTFRRYHFFELAPRSR